MMRSRALATAGEHFGAMLFVRRCGEFVLRLSRYPAGLTVTPHHHPDAYFSYVVAGGMTERGGRGVTERVPGSVHLHAAGEAHAGRVGPRGLLNLSITPGGEWGRRVGERLARRPGSATGEGLHGLARCCARRLEEGAQDHDPELELATLELTAAFVRWRPERPPAHRRRWLDAVREHLETHHATPPRLDDLAALAGVHPVYLARAFRLHFGTSPGGYLKRMRPAAARRALLGSAEAVVSIALACGFSSQSHLTREFSHAFGVPPAAFRRRHRGRR